MLDDHTQIIWLELFLHVYTSAGPKVCYMLHMLHNSLYLELKQQKYATEEEEDSEKDNRKNMTNCKALQFQSLVLCHVTLHPASLLPANLLVDCFVFFCLVNKTKFQY